MGQPHSSVKLAKFLSYILGRQPDEFGLVPDGDGFVKIKDLLKAMHEEEGWRYVRQGALNEVVMTLRDAPVEIAGKQIRAVNRDLLPCRTIPETLPKLLYTTVRSKAHPVVLEKGIQPLGGFSHVIMSSDRTMAERIGRRIDAAPVVLTVQVAWVIQQGVQIQQFGENLFLAKSIPAGTFTAPPLPKEKAEARPRKKVPEEIVQTKTPGSFTLDFDDFEEKAKRQRERKKKKMEREKERRQMRKKKRGLF